MTISLTYFLSTYLNVKIVDSKAEMMTSLSIKNGESFFNFFYLFLFYLSVFLILYTFNTYFQEKVALLWRKELTEIYISKYLSSQNYLRLISIKELDNPDQRIAEDINSFVNNSITIYFLIFDSLLQLFAYSIVLWNISSLLVYSAYFLSVITTILGLKFFGNKMTILNSEKYKLEADMRFSLIHLRENSTTIAFLKREKFANILLSSQLNKIIENIKKLILLKAELSFFQLGTKNIFSILPLVFLSGEFFLGKIPFGTIEQGSVSFVTILFALNVLVDQIQKISILKADALRLHFFNERMNEPHERIALRERDSEFYVKGSNLSIFTPTGICIVENVNIHLSREETYFISGPNGSGKTTFLKTLVGHHSDFSGELEVFESIVVVPDLPFFLDGDILPQIIEGCPEITEQELRDKFFSLVNLPENLILNRESSGKNNHFSMGELQKLNLLRVFLNPEDIYFFDETLNYIDRESLEIIYSNLLKNKIKFNTISQNIELKKYHTKFLEIRNKKIM